MLDINKKYNLIYADPAWPNRDSASAGNRGAVHKYKLMPLEEICSLPISNISADNCLLAMWWVGVMPREALTVCESWGFRLFNMHGLTWVKTTKHGKLHFGMGSLTRANVENMLFGTRGDAEHILFGIKGKVSALRKNASIRQTIHAPVGRHSEKPDVFRQTLVKLCGDVPRIELFARTNPSGWDTWGNEA